MKILAVIHGRAPMRESVRGVMEEWKVEHPEHELSFFVTTAQASAYEHVRSHPEVDLVISAGGDGTNNEVVNGLMALSPENRPVLAILPLGSGNDFARMLPERTPLAFMNAVAEGKTRPIDVLRILSGDREHFALNMITCGIGAEIAATVNRRKYKLPPAFNYYSAIIQWLLRYRSPKVTYTLDGVKHSSPTLLAAFGNGTYAGNGLGLNPQSTIDDGVMGATLIGDVGVLDFLRYQSTLKAAAYVQDERLHYTKAHKADLQVMEGTCSIETDGEPFITLEPGDSASIELLPQALRLI